MGAAVSGAVMDLVLDADAVEVSESPIEAAMLVALLAGRKHTRCRLRLSGRGIVGQEYLAFFVTLNGVTALLVPQVRVGRYRLDLGVVLEHAGRRVYAAVECDGREFHSHPDDVARDKTRDRDLAEAGWVVCRFPGSEIARGGAELGQAVWRFLASVAGAWCGDNDMRADLSREA